MNGKFSYLNFKNSEFVKISQEQYDKELVSKKKPFIGVFSDRVAAVKDFLTEEAVTVWLTLVGQRDNPSAALDFDLLRRFEQMLIDAEKAKAETELTTNVPLS